MSVVQARAGKAAARERGAAVDARATSRGQQGHGQPAEQARRVGPRPEKLSRGLAPVRLLTLDRKIFFLPEPGSGKYYANAY